MAAADFMRDNHEQIQQHVQDLTRDTVGTAAAFVLTGRASGRFAELIGDSHAVQCGTLRTFLPRVVPRDASDGRRHRFLTRRSFLDSMRDPKPTARILWARSRDLALTTRLPDGVLAVDRELRRRLDDLLLASLLQVDEAPVLPAEELATAVAEPPIEESPQEPEPGETVARATPLDLFKHRPRAPKSAPQSTSTARPTEAETGASPASGVLTSIKAVVGRVLGGVPVTVEAIRRLGDLAVAGAAASAAHADLKARIDGLETELLVASDERDSLRADLEGEQLDHAIASDQVRELERQTRSLQIELSRVGLAEQAWSVPDVAPRDIAPDSFADLLDRFDELEYLRFTGDASEVLELGERDAVGTWAKKTWDALLALDDYAAARLGSYRGSIDQFLQNPPHGSHVFPPNKHAYTESETVQNNPKMRRERMLPVPKAVHQAGVVFMPAHFKITISGTISPRMHYYDDLSGTRKIYVGYIGSHLTNTQTN
ncbi:hypothetical protein [Tsukamurella soli]|uniref:Uncharacterized protein n=1 Tax=Tsukamurella soli TaxID=644556 RepID=A0ABP8IZW0_9ACTN